MTCMFTSPFCSESCFFPFCAATSQAVSVLFQCLLRALASSGGGSATWSGSCRHLSTVSKTRCDTVYCWSSSLWDVATSSIPVFMRSGAPAAHYVSSLVRGACLTPSLIRGDCLTYLPLIACPDQ